MSPDNRYKTDSVKRAVDWSCSFLFVNTFQVYLDNMKDNKGCLLTVELIYSNIANMDSCEAAGTICRLPREDKNLPIIAMTTNAMEKDKEAALENGMNAEAGNLQMIKRKVDNFDLAQICQSGQCFRMKEKSEGLYSVIAGRRYLELEQQGEECIFYCEEAEFHDFWEEYFDLKGDYASYIGKIIPDDTYLRNAAEFGSGIRILRQDLWETIVSFLISQQNNIARIRRCIENICERYGEKLVNGQGEIFYAFPAPETLADLEENALMECNLGYRSKYVVRTARSVASGEFDLEDVRQLPYGEARIQLLKLFGVGEKVADCICLFALHKLEAFPVDTHINQALQVHYKHGFPMDRYHGIQGVLQQYIFYYELAGDKVMPQ